MSPDTPPRLGEGGIAEFGVFLVCCGSGVLLVVSMMHSHTQIMLDWL